MPRRGENIRKRKDGRWEARYPSGQNNKGVKKYSSVYGNTYREAKEKRQLAIQQSNSITYPNDVNVFKDVLQLWMEDNRIRLKEATIYRYSYLIETHILPELGDMKVYQITGTVINRFLTKKVKCGRIDGKGGLSPSYVRSIMLIVSAAIRYAAGNGLCDPLRTQVNKPPIQPKEPVILSRDVQEKLESSLLHDIDGTKIGVYISLYTGLRIGEIAIAIISAISFACTLKIMKATGDAVGACRMLLAILCMAGAACVDFREHRIPNFFPCVMAIGGIILLAVGVIAGINGALAHVTTSVVSAACCVLFLFIASALTKQGIGAGDIKLVGALALLAGLFGVIGTLFWGVTISGVIAAILLLCKKQDRHGSLPFGPFLFLGLVITIFTGNF